jgi:hypothetical protein
VYLLGDINNHMLAVMAETEEISTGPNQGASVPTSRRSSRSRRRSSANRNTLTRILSGNHLDDHSHYLHHPHEKDAFGDEESSDGGDLPEKESDETGEDLEGVPSEEGL